MNVFKEFKAKIINIDMAELGDVEALKLLEMEWQDHFQTREQTWKALHITAVLAVALVGLDWQVKQAGLTAAASILLFLVALCGSLITLRHRNETENTIFSIILAIEKKLGFHSPDLHLPKPIQWWDVFLIWKSSTPLFMLRMHVAIQIFAIGYLVVRLTCSAPA